LRERGEGRGGEAGRRRGSRGGGGRRRVSAAGRVVGMGTPWAPLQSVV
jgi:hypothetical protein